MRNYSLTEIAATPAANWRGRLIAEEPVLDIRIRQALMWDHGESATMGVLADLTDAELLRSPNIGARSLHLLRTAIAYWADRVQEEALEATKTVLWRDGDHGTEFITPEEDERRRSLPPEVWRHPFIKSREDGVPTFPTTA